MRSSRLCSAVHAAGPPLIGGEIHDAVQLTHPTIRFLEALVQLESRLDALAVVAQGEPFAVAHQRHVALMEGLQRAAMADRDDGGGR
jgi:hypothetical protein